MRLGIDIRELERGRRTGIGRYLRCFIDHASAARPEGRFILYGNQRTDPAAAGAGRANVEVRLRPEGATAWWDQVVLPRLICRDGLDAFLSPYVKGPVRASCPLAITIHDLMTLALPGYATWRAWPRNLAFRWMARQVGRRADLVFADSQHTAGDVRRLLGLDPQRVRVLPMSVGEEFAPVPPARRAPALGRHGLRQPYVLYVGNYKPHKNVPVLVRAFAGLPPPRRRDHLLALGGRTDGAEVGLRRLATELGVGEQVRLLGLVGDEDLPSLYSGAAAFAFPSLYEGFGLPPLEAMACGTPVVCSSRTSLPEVVGEAGLLVDPEDVDGLSRALERLLGDDGERQRLAGLGLERAARFRAAAVAERQLEALEELARAGRAR